MRNRSDRGEGAILLAMLAAFLTLVATCSHRARPVTQAPDHEYHGGHDAGR